MDHVNALLLTLARKGENAMKHMKVRPIGCPQCAGFRALESIAGLFRNYFNNRYEWLGNEYSSHLTEMTTAEL